jgi:hypothetical protein
MVHTPREVFICQDFSTFTCEQVKFDDIYRYKRLNVLLAAIVKSQSTFTHIPNPKGVMVV